MHGLFRLISVYNVRRCIKPLLSGHSSNILRCTVFTIEGNLISIELRVWFLALGPNDDNSTLNNFNLPCMRQEACEILLYLGLTVKHWQGTNFL